MILKEYKKEDIKNLIKDHFKTDDELIKLYHLKSGTDVETCAEQTFQDLQHTDNSSFKFYEILDNETSVGYFGTEFGIYLTTIFINPLYRNKDKVSIIWSLIKSRLHSEFNTAIYKKNTRALNFYLKNNAKIINEGITNNTPYVLLGFKEV